MSSNAAPSPGHSAGENLGSISADLEAQAVKCERRFRKLERQLKRAAVKSSKTRQAAERRWLGSHAVRVAATAAANRKLHKDIQVELPAVFEAAKAVRPGHPLDEPARLYAVRKASGGTRPIWDFGLTRRAVVETLKPIVRPSTEPRAFQYDWRGVPAAIKAVKAAVLDGLVYAARLDISNHFGSFDIGALPHQLRLRKKIVEHSVAGKGIPVLNEGALPSLLVTTARQGLPQGSGLSPLIALNITSRLDWQVPQGIRLFNYADDFLVLGSTKEAADAAADALCAAIMSLPGGHFSSNKQKDTQAEHVGDGVAFLGHLLIRWTDIIEVTPTLPNCEALDGRIMEYERKARKAAPGWATAKQAAGYGLPALGDAWAFARSWARAFRECDDTPTALAVIKSVLDDDLKAFKSAPADFFESYKNPDAVWKHTGSAHDPAGSGS